MHDAAKKDFNSLLRKVANGMIQKEKEEWPPVCTGP